jgi:formylglycine-generating enzyme required for sulfatase activity
MMHLNRRMALIKAVLLLAAFSSVNCFLDPSRIRDPNNSNKVQTANSNLNKMSKPDPFKTKVDYTNPIGMEFMKIPAGSFMMGSPESEDKPRHSDEPMHQVTIGYSFYVGKYEVTQEQYEKVIGKNPSKSGKCADYCCDDPNCPVENLSWKDTQEFLRKLNITDGRYKYRLPSEAEWEYSCRAGTTTVFAFGNDLSSDMANFNGALPYGRAPRGPNVNRAVPVGSYLPNAWGLNDMHGNVTEWCEDFYQEDYKNLPTNGAPKEKPGEFGKARVHRGGAYGSSGRALRCADRDASDPNTPWTAHGFRLVATQR